MIIYKIVSSDGYKINYTIKCGEIVFESLLPTKNYEWLRKDNHNNYFRQLDKQYIDTINAEYQTTSTDCRLRTDYQISDESDWEESKNNLCFRY